MKRIGTLLILVGISVLGCRRSTPPLTDARLGVSNGDHLVGWFKMTSNDTMIPVFGIDGNHYSVCRGFEIPFKKSAEGLEWALTPSSMVGTTIGFDKTSNVYYIIVEDQGLKANYEPYVSGQKRPMTRVDKPSGLLDPMAPPPRNNADFLGWYQPVWPPWLRFGIRKDGDRHLVAMPGLDGKTEEEPRELTPLPERLGSLALIGRTDTV